MKKSLQLSIAYTSFVFHAMPGSVLGVVWPNMRETFGMPLDALGAVLLTVTMGYFLASLSNGRLLQMLGMGRTLLLSWVFATVGVAGYALTPAWWLLLVSAFLVGFSGGTLVTGLNVFISSAFSHRHMNWMHANYGLGAALGPVTVAFLASRGMTWQQSYGLLAVLQGVMGGVIMLTLNYWRLNDDAENNDENGKRMSNGRTLRMPVVWLSLLLFFLYVGVETTTGQWSFTLLTQSRDIPALLASTWISIYWGSLTVGRLLVGFAVERMSVNRVLQLSMGGAVAGTLLLSWPTAVSSFMGLALTGFSCAAIFPLLTSDTPRRVGLLHTTNAMGLQNAAASLGLAMLPGAAGLLADSISLEIIGPFVVLLTLLLWGAFQWLAHITKMSSFTFVR